MDRDGGNATSTTNASSNNNNDSPGSAGSLQSLAAYDETEFVNWTDHDMDVYVARNATHAASSNGGMHRRGLRRTHVDDMSDFDM
jgi:hypothetical protein